MSTEAPSMDPLEVLRRKMTGQQTNLDSVLEVAERRIKAISEGSPGTVMATLRVLAENVQHLERNGSTHCPAGTRPQEAR